MTKIFLLAHERLTYALAAVRDREEGQGTTEYVVLLAGIVGMALAVVGVLSTGLQGAITDIIDSIGL